MCTFQHLHPEADNAPSESWPGVFFAYSGPGGWAHEAGSVGAAPAEAPPGRSRARTARPETGAEDGLPSAGKKFKEVKA